MKFNEAFEAAVEDGERIQRIGWNDGRLWVKAVSETKQMQAYFVAEAIRSRDDYVSRFVYQPSTQDLFAKDWITYNGAGK